MKFFELESAIKNRGVKKSVIAKRLGISERALRYKINGDSSFSWEQVCEIQGQFFPDMEIKNLFATDQRNRAS